MQATLRQDSRFRLSEALARELAEVYGTPLYVLDEAHFRARVRRYLSAFRSVWPRCEIAFASKANSTLAVLAMAHQEGCRIDVASEGELRAAMAAGVPAADCHLHGNNKSAQELRFAVEAGVGQIVVDHFGEIEAISDVGSRISDGVQTDLRDPKSDIPSLVLRLAPGVDPVTHQKISTGQADTKFGFSIADGSAEKALLRCLELGLPVVGFHCHVGSQLLDPEAQRSGGELIARFAAEMKRRHGFEASYLNVGGGLGVRYTDDDDPIPVEEYCRLVVEAIRGALEGSGLSPTLAQEPGRSLIAESCVTLYTVGAVKTVPTPRGGSRTYVSVDGGLSDNPRPALYGARYTVERVSPRSDVSQASRGHEHRLNESAEMAGWTDTEQPQVNPAEIGNPTSELAMTVAGKHCETDTLFEDVLLPGDLKSGDLLQVLCTGAYNSSMASNYNRFPRPATALLRSDGSHTLVQRRDSWEEMIAREILPGDLAR